MAGGATQSLAQEAFPHAVQIDQLVKPYLTHKKVNAVSVGVISKGQVWKKGFGTLDGEGSAAPNDKTLYEIGSISKVFTSLLLADAVESGKLKLSDPIGKVLPELTKKNPQVGKSITFLNLSLHNSGLPVMPTNLAPADSTNPFADYGRNLLDKYMLSAKPARKPGAKYEYSNLAVGLLGDLLSRQADKSYEELLKEKIVKPLNMTDTTITLSDDQRARFAPPHNSALLPDKTWEFDALVGCGGIRSSIDDMLLFAQAMLDPPSGQLGKAIELAWKQHKPAKGDDFAMGLGWMIARDGSTRWHNGQTGGFHCMLLVNRDMKCAAVVLCNTADPQIDGLAEQVIQAAMGLKVEPRVFEEEFQVDPKVVERLAGKYQLAPGAVITVQVKDGKMMAQLTGQQFLALSPKSETEWKYQLVDATLKFELPKEGQSPKVTLLQNGREMASPRIPD